MKFNIFKNEQVLFLLFITSLILIFYIYFDYSDEEFDFNKYILIIIQILLVLIFDNNFNTVVSIMLLINIIVLCYEYFNSENVIEGRRGRKRRSRRINRRKLAAAKAAAKDAKKEKDDIANASTMSTSVVDLLVKKKEEEARRIEAEKLETERKAKEQAEKAAAIALQQAKQKNELVQQKKAQEEARLKLNEDRKNMYIKANTTQDKRKLFENLMKKMLYPTMTEEFSKNKYFDPITENKNNPDYKQFIENNFWKYLEYERVKKLINSPEYNGTISNYYLTYGLDDYVELIDKLSTNKIQSAKNINSKYDYLLCTANLNLMIMKSNFIIGLGGNVNSLKGKTVEISKFGTDIQNIEPEQIIGEVEKISVSPFNFIPFLIDTMDQSIYRSRYADANFKNIIPDISSPENLNRISEGKEPISELQKYTALNLITNGIVNKRHLNMNLDNDKLSGEYVNNRYIIESQNITFSSNDDEFINQINKLIIEPVYLPRSLAESLLNHVEFREGTTNDSLENNLFISERMNTVNKDIEMSEQLLLDKQKYDTELVNLKNEKSKIQDNITSLTGKKKFISDELLGTEIF